VSFIKIIKSEVGMSLVSVMMAAGMVGGLAMVIAKLSQNSSKVQRSAIENQDMISFINNVQKHMLNNKACDNTFASVTGLNSNGTSVAIPSIINAFGNTVYNTSNKPPSKTYNITGIVARRVADTDLHLRISLEKTKQGKSFGAKSITKIVKLDALYSAAGKITKCYSQFDNAVVNAREQACADIDPNATWSEALGCQISNEFDDRIAEKACKDLDVNAVWTVADGCVLSQGEKNAIFEDALNDKFTKIQVYLQGGNVTTIAPFTIVRCTVNSKRCRRTNYQDCTPSCPSGYSNVGRASGRFDVSQGTWDKKCCRNYKCEKNNSVGLYLLQDK
jgi:type II secretory pathway pseudopilin PulG